MMHKSLDIAVLSGGWNSEKEVSLVSGKEILLALKKKGYSPRHINPSRDLEQFIGQLSPRPDIVFNTLHGSWGEDGKIQSVLDLLSIPYTSSGATVSAVAMDKVLTSRICRDAGIRVPKFIESNWEIASKTHLLSGSYVIKPRAEGSSVGVYIVREGDGPIGVQVKSWSFGPLMVEEFIDGQEISVPVLNGKALGALELVPQEGFYDYKAKYTDGVTKHVYPAKIPETAYKECLAFAEVAHKALGCRGVTRSDFRYDQNKEKIYFLEINTQPGMTPLSIVPDVAKHTGYSFEDIIDEILKEALCR